jgi:regulator of sirC expression with transglutaminase-like and TPR domain
MTNENPTTERLTRLINRPEEGINLAEVALLFAQDEYPQLDIGAYLRRLDDLSGDVRARLSPAATPENMIAAMNHVLFEEEGFAGNGENYYDPRNSFLNDVLDRRLGIPITLSILYMEVGLRVGLSLKGVSFPGHFLVSLGQETGRVVLDPYSGGNSLSEEELINRLPQYHGRRREIALSRSLAGVGKKEILVRMLHNLKAIYLHEENYTKALSVVDRILLIRADWPEELRDRGLLYEQLECAQSAIQDYRRYLELQPDGSDVREIRSRIIQLGKTSPPLQ